MIQAQLARRRGAVLAPEHEQARAILVLQQHIRQLAMAQQHLQRRYARLIHARLGLVQHAPRGLLRDMGALFVQGVQALEQHVLRAHADDAAVVAHRRHGLGPLQRVQQGHRGLQALRRPEGAIHHGMGGGQPVDAGENGVLVVHGAPSWRPDHGLSVAPWRRLCQSTLQCGVGFR